MVHFKLILVITTLGLSLSSNSLPLTSRRQVEAAHQEVARNLVPGIDPRSPKKSSSLPAKKPAPPPAKPPPAKKPAPPPAKPPPAKTTAKPKTTLAKTSPAKTVAPPKTTKAKTTLAKSSSAKTVAPPKTTAKTTLAKSSSAKTVAPPKTTQAKTTLAKSSSAKTVAPPKTTAKTTLAKSSSAKTVAPPKTTQAKTTLAKSSSAKTVVPPKTTAKTVAPPKTTQAKTTLAKSSSAKTVAPAKTTSSLAKSSSIKSSATKSVAASSSSHASSTLKSSAKPTTTAATGKNATQCTPPTSSKKQPAPAKPARSLISRVLRLLRRDSQEFIGLHGTNSATAAFWASNGGKITKPPGNTGVLDFLGVTSSSTSGTSKADEELGPGLYITDDTTLAQAFGNGNAQVNKGTTPKVCAIFAASSDNWRTAITKVFIPESLVGDSSTPAQRTAKENNRLTYIQKAGVATTASAAVKFSLLNRAARTGQMSLPSLLTNQFIAKCFDAGTAPNTALSGLPDLTTFRYDSQALRTAWNIKAENQAVADEVTAACNT